MLGANPMVSHGSVLTAPRVRDQLHAITTRGGRVLVVDPRRTETARQFEHVPITPDADAWLLLSLLHVIFEEGLADCRFLAGWTRDAGTLQTLAAPHPPEETEQRTGVPAATVRALARDFAAADGAAAYGRTGSCLGRHGTVVAFLIDALNAVTGNLDRPGGAVFGRPSIALDDVGRRIGLDTYGKSRSRIGDFPDVLGNMPASLLPQEIETPGRKQLRALFVSAGNPVLSVPDGDALERAFGKLDLLVSLDFYVNETNRHADYVLPTTTFLERDDTPVAFLGFYTTPFVQHSDAVVAPPGEAREEWEIIEDLARPLGVTPSSVRELRFLGRFGISVSPQRLLDLLLRTGPDGDWFGLRRRGLSLSKLRRNPHGIVLADHVATGVLRGKLHHRDKRIRLAPKAIVAEIERLGAGADDDAGDPRYPLRLIGLRELRSHNSWMHNSPLLLRGGRTHAARVHPDDAAAAGLADGDTVCVTSKSGSIELPVKLTDEMKPGTVAVPHGWGHRGGWRLANERAGGVNVNVLSSGAPEDLERLAGMAFLNGIPVRLDPVDTPAAVAADEPELASARV
jgi:formate dehydrogenase